MDKKATNDAITSGLKQLNAVVSAWSAFAVPTAWTADEDPMQPLTDFAGDIREIYADALNRQFDLLLQGTTKLSDWTPALMPGGQTQRPAEAQRDMLASLLEASSQRAEIWTDMSRQLGTRYTAFMHQLAQDIAHMPTAQPASAPEDPPVSGRKKAK